MREGGYSYRDNDYDKDDEKDDEGEAADALVDLAGALSVNSHMGRTFRCPAKPLNDWFGGASNV